jgi:hypothetical protein
VIIIIRKRAGEFAGRVRKRFRSRAIEWEHASIMTIFGMILLINPAVFEGPSFTAFPGDAAWWGWGMLFAGLARFAALGINGYMARPTALVRALSALSGIVLFAAISLGLLFSWTWPTGLAPYPVLGFFGLFSLYWAIFDVAIPDDHHDA